MSGEESTTPPTSADAAGEEASGEQGAIVNGEIRQKLFRQFEQWVDRMLAGEPEPDGLPEDLLAEARAAEAPAPGPGRECDLYAVFASLTGLTGEVKLQGRAFKQLGESLAPLGDVASRLEDIGGRLAKLEQTQAESVDHLAELIERHEHRAVVESAMPAAKDLLEVLFDLRERMQRGLSTFQTGMDAIKPGDGGLLWRMGGGPRRMEQATAASQGLREGYEMTLSRLQAALQQWGIERVGEVGRPFDPQKMSVVDVGEDGSVPEGTVLEVYRSGYALGGELLATAQVKVSRADGALK